MAVNPNQISTVAGLKVQLATLRASLTDATAISYAQSAYDALCKLEAAFYAAP